MRTLFAIFALFAVLSAAEVSRSQGVYFSFDYSIFRDAEGRAILEVYYSVPQRRLKYEKTGEGFESSVRLDVDLKNKLDGSSVVQKTYKAPSAVRDTSDKASMQNMIGQMNFSLDPGTYSLTVKGSDFAQEGKEEQFSTEFIVYGNSSGSADISDIELSSLIRKSENSSNAFYKNTLEVIPNPSGLFGRNLADMYYYYELYGLTQANVGDKYNIQYSVVSLNRDTLMILSKDFPTKAVSKVDFGKIKVDTMRSGSYYFNVVLRGSDGSEKASAEKKFFVFTDSAVVTESNRADGFLVSIYAAMPQKEVEREFEEMAYIMTDKQKATFETLDSLSAKRKYIYNFWKVRDQNQNTPELETRLAYFKRVDEAKKLYSEGFKEGWKSDRGRILILYGKPDDIERYPFQTSTKSYEKWIYDAVEGGGECVFIELQPTTGVYWLVHSTFRAELKNPTWEEQLKP